MSNQIKKLTISLQELIAKIKEEGIPETTQEDIDWAEWDNKGILNTRKEPEMKKYKHYDEKEITGLLIGRKVEVISATELLLDNGLVLEILGNEGCGGCAAGWYELKELNGCDNAITNVEFIEDSDTLDTRDQTSYKIFVFTVDKRIKLIQVDGDDGNGYYGTGYTIYVKIKE